MTDIFTSEPVFIEGHPTGTRGYFKLYAAGFMKADMPMFKNMVKRMLSDLDTREDNARIVCTFLRENYSPHECADRIAYIEKAIDGWKPTKQDKLIMAFCANKRSRFDHLTEPYYKNGFLFASDSFSIIRCSTDKFTGKLKEGKADLSAHFPTSEQVETGFSKAFLPDIKTIKTWNKGSKTNTFCNLGTLVKACGYMFSLSYVEKCSAITGSSVLHVSKKLAYMSGNGFECVFFPIRMYCGEENTVDNYPDNTILLIDSDNNIISSMKIECDIPTGKDSKTEEKSGATNEINMPEMRKRFEEQLEQVKAENPLLREFRENNADAIERYNNALSEQEKDIIMRFVNATHYIYGRMDIEDWSDREKVALLRALDSFKDPEPIPAEDPAQVPESVPETTAARTETVSAPSACVPAILHVIPSAVPVIRHAPSVVPSAMSP